MARKPTLLDLLDKYEPPLAKAFIAAIQEITSKVQIGRVAEALERGDINRAIEALYLDRAAFERFEETIREAYLEGGRVTVDDLPVIKQPDGSRFVIRFNARNLRAEQWLREHSSELVTRVIAEQRDSIRSHLQTGLQDSRNPRSVGFSTPSASPDSNTSGLSSISSPQMSRFITEKGKRVPSRTSLSAKRDGMRLPRAWPFRSAAATRMVRTFG